MNERAPTAKPPGCLHRLVQVCVWAYLLGVLAVWLLLNVAGDRWWVATVMLYAPRWIYLLPLLLLLPSALFVRRRLMFVLGLAVLIVAGPIAGFQIPLIWPEAEKGPRIRVLSCNIERWTNDSPQALKRLIETTSPDIVAIQEHVGQVPSIWPEGWRVERRAELLVATPYPLTRVEPDSEAASRIYRHGDVAMWCVVSTPAGEVRFCNVHLQSPRSGLEPVLSRWTILRPSQRHRLVASTDYRREQSGAVSQFARQEFKPDLVAGDFNLTVDSAIYRRFWRGFRNAFNEVGWGYGFTKNSEKRGLTYGTRIDHMLSTTKWRPVRCWVEADIGSDHLPLIADFVLHPTDPVHPVE